MLLKTTLVALSITFLCTTKIFSQELKGQILCKQTKEAIPYVSIGVVGASYGTYTNKNGEYHLQIKDYKATDSIRFSCIGFVSACYKLRDLLKDKGDVIDLDINLNEKNYALDEVVVRPKRYGTLNLGNKRSSGIVLIGIIKEKERGVVIENNKRLHLSKVSFKLISFEDACPDSIVLRFNIYSLKNGIPYENIVTQPIYFHLAKNQLNGMISFDISQYNLVVENDFAATFEFVNQFGKGRTYFAGQYWGCKTISRIGQQGAWANVVGDSGNVKLKQSLIITAIYEK